MRHTIPIKKIISLLSLLIFYSICLSHQVVGQTDMSKNDPGKTLKLMTYNLKFASPDYEPSWNIRRDKFRLREVQSFQLSETPEIIGS
ncbi:MAG: hypothetical protein MUC93_14125 [Bacteroidales bacterium]|jgi:hypothetical protein|nr:hypothetical protein [Bacteroidales bacterium]